MNGVTLFAPSRLLNIVPSEPDDYLVIPVTIFAGDGSAPTPTPIPDPTPIQIESIPKLSLGSDIVGKAQTGTGKTTAFSIPLIQKIDHTKTTTQGIVLVPTGELAVQVTGEIKKLSQFLPIRTTTLYGGQPIIKQIEELR